MEFGDKWLNVTHKKCALCARVLPMESFSFFVIKDRKYPASRCSFCRSKGYKYGISLSFYEKMIAAQQNLCAVCGLPESKINRKTGVVESLRVDHNHETKAIRGLLCNRCNIVLGHVGDSTQLLCSLIAYLKSPPAEELEITAYGGLVLPRPIISADLAYDGGE